MAKHVLECAKAEKIKQKLYESFCLSWFCLYTLLVVSPTSLTAGDSCLCLL